MKNKLKAVSLENDIYFYNHSNIFLLPFFQTNKLRRALYIYTAKVIFEIAINMSIYCK